MFASNEVRVVLSLSDTLKNGVESGAINVECILMAAEELDRLKKELEDAEKAYKDLSERFNDPR